MLAHVLGSKFIDHLPFYRQSQMYKRQGLHIPESTIGGWFNAGCNLLKFLYDSQKNIIQSSDYLMADESRFCSITVKPVAGKVQMNF